MKDYSRRIYLSIFWMVLGAILFVMGVMGKLDSFWSGMGGALIAVGGLQTIRWSKYRRNEDYRELALSFFISFGTCPSIRSAFVPFLLE